MLPRLVGWAKAAELYYRARTISAQEALDIGIVNAVDLGLFKSVFFSADANADFNGDGVVNVIDLGTLKAFFFLAPGPSFGPYPHHVRICFTSAAPEIVRRGVDVLASKL